METPSDPRIQVTDVQIPIRVLTAADCDESIDVPSPLPEGSDMICPPPLQVVAIVAPPTSEPGCLLHIPIGEGEQVIVTLPVTATAGDDILLLKRADGWRAVKRTKEYSYLVPDTPPTGEETIDLPDSTKLQFGIPEGLKPGHIVNFRVTEDGLWAIKSVSNLPEVTRDADMPRSLNDPLLELFDIMKGRGYLQKMRVDENGELRVNLPFCGSFQIYPALGNFLADEVLTLPGVTGTGILASDIDDSWSFYWAVAQRWFGKMHPQIRLRYEVCDLSVDALPEAGLCLAFHPEVTKGGCWFQIIGSLVRSARRGLLVFTTFYEQEMQTVVNMVNMYKDDDTTVETVENPFYKKNQSLEDYDMRYFIFVIGAPP